MNKKRVLKTILIIIALIIIISVIFIGSICYQGAKQGKFLAENHTVQEKINFCSKKTRLKDDCLMSAIMFSVEIKNGADLSMEDEKICFMISDSGKRNACYVFLAKTIKEDSLCSNVEDDYYKDVCISLSKKQQETASLYRPYTVDSYNINKQNLELIDLQERTPNSYLDLGSGKVLVISGKRAIYKSEELPDDTATLKLHAEEFSPSDYAKAVESIVIKQHEGYQNNPNHNETKKINYKNHEIYLTEQTSYNNDKIYSGSVAVGNVLFPEDNIIVTIYFFDTLYYNVDEISFDDFMKKLTENVISGVPENTEIKENPFLQPLK